MIVDDIIKYFDFMFYLEGGYYCQIWIVDEEGCFLGILIYFFLQVGEIFYWYCVDVIEIWYYYVGVLFLLYFFEIDDGLVVMKILSFDFV